MVRFECGKTLNKWWFCVLRNINSICDSSYIIFPMRETSNLWQDELHSSSSLENVIILLPNSKWIIVHTYNMYVQRKNDYLKDKCGLERISYTQRMLNIQSWWEFMNHYTFIKFQFSVFVYYFLLPGVITATIVIRNLKKLFAFKPQNQFSAQRKQNLWIFIVTTASFCYMVFEYELQSEILRIIYYKM